MMMQDKIEVAKELAGELIKKYEGLELEAYKDAAGIWTIGYGHTSMAGPPKVYKGMKITKEEAEEIFERDLSKFTEEVISVLGFELVRRLEPFQLAALISFAYNVGIGAFSRSTLLKKVRALDFLGAEQEFYRWVYSGGKRLRGLVRRRQEEAAMFRGENLDEDMFEKYMEELEKEGVLAKEEDNSNESKRTGWFFAVISFVVSVVISVGYFLGFDLSFLGEWLQRFVEWMD